MDYQESRVDSAKCGLNKPPSGGRWHAKRDERSPSCRKLTITRRKPYFTAVRLFHIFRKGKYFTRRKPYFTAVRLFHIFRKGKYFTRRKPYFTVPKGTLLPAGSFSRLRRQLPLGGSLDLRRAFNYHFQRTDKLTVVRRSKTKIKGETREEPLPFLFTAHRRAGAYPFYGRLLNWFSISFRYFALPA